MGSLVVLGELFFPASFVARMPGIFDACLGSAICLILAGIGLALSKAKRAPFRFLCNASITVLLALTAAAMLMQWILAHYAETGWTDTLHGIQSWLGMSRLMPALALFVTAIALFLLDRIRSNAGTMTVHCMAMAIIAIAMAGMFAGAVNNVVFYRQASVYTLGNLPMVIGLMMTGLGIHLTALPIPWFRSFFHQRADRRIFVTGMALFLLVSLVSGVATIMIVGRNATSNFQDALWSSFRSNAELFRSALHTAVNRSAEIVRLSELEQSVARRASDAHLQRELERIVQRVDYDELVSLKVVDIQGKPLASIGEEPYEGWFSAPLSLAPLASLYWNDGWHVIVRTPLNDGNREVGTAIADVAMRRFDRLYAQMNRLGESGEMRVCVPLEGRMNCFPSRLLPQTSSFPLNPAGRPLAMNLALNGEHGVTTALDYRGNEVIAAYGMVDGIGVVQKINVDEFYGPLRHQLWLALFGLAMLILGGASTLYWKTRPLVTQLVRARASLDATLNHVPAGVVTIDRSGIIRSANQRAAEIFGYPVENLCGMQVGALLSSDTFPVSVLQQGKQDLSGKRCDGSEFRAEVSASEFLFAHEWKTIAIIQDVTQRRKTEELLSRWGQAFEHAGWGVAIEKADGTTLEMVNPAFLRMHGYAAGNPGGTTSAMTKVPELPGARRERLSLGPANADQRFETIHQRKDGDTFPVWVDRTPVRDAQGKLRFYVINVLDVTERKRMEQELKQSEQLLRKILDTVPIGVCVTDRDGHVIIENPIGKKLWHCSGCGLHRKMDEHAVWEANTGRRLFPEEWGITRALLRGESTLSELIEIDCGHGTSKTISNSVVPLRSERDDILGAVIVSEDVTQSRQAELALKKSEASLAQAQRIAHLGSWERDVASGAQFWSAETYRILGIAREEPALDYQSFLALVHSDDRDCLQKASYDAVRKGLPYEVEFRFISRDGAEKALYSRAQVSYGPRGHDVRLVGTIQDITEKKHAEDLLRKREHEFRALVENSPDVVSRIDRELRCIYVNPVIENVGALSQQAVIGKTFGEMNIGARAASVLTEECIAVFDSAQTRTFDLVFTTPSGSMCYQIRLVPEFGPAGHVHTVLAIGRDVSLIKSSEAILRASEQRLHGIAANTPGMVFQCTLNLARDVLMFSFVSEGATLLFGVTPQQIRMDSEALKDRIHEQDRYALRRSLRQSARTMTVLNWEGRATRQTGEEIWVNCRATPRAGDDGSIIWEGVMFNITTSKQHEEELRRSRQLLRELSAHLVNVREGERKRIAREIHDELGQALTVMRMEVSLMRLRFGELDPMLMERIRSMKETVDRTIGIVRHVTSALRPAALDLGLTAALEWLVEDFSKHGEIACRLIADESEVVLDDDQATALFRIAQESLTNVLKHAKATAVEIILRAENGQIQLQVRDNGRGLTSGETGKTGAFGLLGMRERALMLGGGIEIASAAGAGTCVQVQIPLARPREQVTHEGEHND